MQLDGHMQMSGGRGASEIWARQAVYPGGLPRGWGESRGVSALRLATPIAQIFLPRISFYLRPNIWTLSLILSASKYFRYISENEINIPQFHFLICYNSRTKNGWVEPFYHGTNSWRKQHVINICKTIFVILEVKFQQEGGFLWECLFRAFLDISHNCGHLFLFSSRP